MSGFLTISLVHVYPQQYAGGGRAGYIGFLPPPHPLPKAFVPKYAIDSPKTCMLYTRYIFSTIVLSTGFPLPPPPKKGVRSPINTPSTPPQNPAPIYETNITYDHIALEGCAWMNGCAIGWHASSASLSFIGGVFHGGSSSDTLHILRYDAMRCVFVFFFFPPKRVPRRAGGIIYYRL